MTISVTEFKAKCLHLIRQVEAHGTPIDIVRGGRVVARLTPAVPLDGRSRRSRSKPWERLRGTGRLEAEPGESMLSDNDFEATH